VAEKVLIRGGTVLSMDPVTGQLDTGDVLVVDGVIAEVAPTVEVSDAEVIDATDMIVMPGFVDTHRHTWEAPLRHLASDWTLGQYLAGLHFGFSRHFRPEDTYAGNLLGAVEALDSGITTLLDWSHNCETPEHGDAAVAGLRDSGMRAVFAHGGGATMWQVPSPVPHDRDVLRLQKEYFSTDDQLVTLGFAARGPQFSSPEATLADWELARELGTASASTSGTASGGRPAPLPG